MWKNVLFSANIVLPSFILIFLGRLITWKGLMKREQMDHIGKLSFTYLLSTKIFNDIYSSDPGSFAGSGIVLFCMFATIGVFAVSWALAGRFMKRKESVGAFVQGCFRCSFTVLGMTMIETFAGAEGVARAAPLLAMASVLFNVLACIVLTKPGEERTVRGVAKTIGKSIATNPIIIAVVIGLVLVFGGIRFPYVIEKPLQDLGNMAPPLALLCIGSSLDTSMVKRSFRYAFIAASVKTWGMAAVALPVAVMLGFRGFDLTVIAIFLTAANPSANYVMALATDSDSDLAASAIVLSTLMCIFTSMIAITTLRFFGLI